MVCSPVCPKCYPCSRPRASGFCGCSNCDPCNRCCGLAYGCTSVTFTIYVSNSPNCFGSGGFAFEENIESQHDVFFEKIKNYNSKLENKMSVGISPFENKKFDFLKKQKKTNLKNCYFLNTNSKTYLFDDDYKKKWFYHRKSFFYDFLLKNKKLNYFFWDSKKWICVHKNKDYDLKPSNYSFPFYVIFDDKLNLIKSDNNYLQKNNFKHCFFEDKKELNCFLNKKNFSINLKNDQSAFFGLVKQINDYCTPKEICYTFPVTFSVPDGNGCGLCCPFVDLNCMTLFSIGGTCIQRTDYSDEYVYLEGPLSGDTPDHFAFAACVKLTECGQQQGLVVAPYVVANCPCPYYSPCNPDPNMRCAPTPYKKNILSLRNQYKKILQGKKRKLR